MRQRKLRNLDTKYEAYADLIIDEPAEMPGRWSERSGGAPLYIEIGCGKGKFISELAAREPEHYFVAVEGNKSVMLRAMEKIRKLGLTNVCFVPEHAGDLSEWFADGEADGNRLVFLGIFQCVVHEIGGNLFDLWVWLLEKGYIAVDTFLYFHLPNLFDPSLIITFESLSSFNIL